MTIKNFFIVIVIVIVIDISSQILKTILDCMSQLLF